MEGNQVLTSLREGQTAQVTAIMATGGIRRRLLDLGLIQGTTVACVQKSPCGDPVAYFIRGATIALRSEDSAQIQIRPTGEYLVH